MEPAPLLGGIEWQALQDQLAITLWKLVIQLQKFCSIFLLALVNTNYRFIWVDIGANGSCSDAQIYNKSALK